MRVPARRGGVSFENPRRFKIRAVRLWKRMKDEGTMKLERGCAGVTRREEVAFLLDYRDCNIAFPHWWPHCWWGYRRQQMVIGEEYLIGRSPALVSWSAASSVERN